MEVETSWMVEMLKALGIGGGPVFATLYFLERRINEALRKEGREQLIQIMTLTATVTAALSGIDRAVTAVGQTSKDGMDALKQLISLHAGGKS